MMKAEKILAVSRATQRDIENLFHIPSSHIEVIANALDERFLLAGRVSGQAEGAARQEDVRLAHERYGVHDPFLLYVGSARPQKNLARLIEAFAAVKGELAGSPRRAAGAYR